MAGYAHFRPSRSTTRPNRSARSSNGSPSRGSRGIGPRFLNLDPQPSLTVISGRNGSGKSSFAEALEVALTGNTYRWSDDRPAVWRQHWRNIHDGEDPRIDVVIAEEGEAPPR